MYVPLIDRENQMDARQQAVKQAIEEQRPIIVTADDDDDEAIGELQVAEYVIFLLALDTYIRYVEEATGVEDPEDDVIRRGIRLLRMADSELGTIRSFLDDNLPSTTHKRMLVKYLRLRVSDSAGVGRRAFGLTRLLNRGGPTTMRAVFKTNRALRQIKVAMASAAMDDGDAALDKYAGLPMQNARIRGWIDLAAKTAGSGELPENPIQAGVKEAADMAPAMLSSQVEEMATTEAEVVQEAQEDQTDKITEVELAATEAARKTMDLSGETDELMTKSEVIGVATAVAAAVTSDPSNPANIPQSLKDTRLDDEQLAAAMTDGRVLVAAGAGAGKSTTLVARIKHLVQDRGVSPSRIMATSFSSDSASELKERVGKSIGKSLTNQMNAGNDRWTLHSTFKKVILAHGTPDEKDAMKGDPKRVSGAVARKVQELWAVCFDGEDRPLPSKGEMEKFKTQWAGNNISPAQAKTDARSIKETDAAQWYEMYEGLKGAIPGWTPPCASQAANAVLGQFMSKVRRGKRLGDFDDMLGIAHRILKDNPGVRKTLQRQFDHVLIDECQDLNLVQNELFEMITEHIDVEKGQSIWMVGDDRQSIYGFRGARPDVFIDRAEKEEWKLRPMRTNYRCEPEHVEASNRLIAHNKKQIGIEANPSPHKTRGTGSLKVLEMPDEATSALSVIEGIKHAAMSESSSDQEKLKFYGTNAVLTRTNKELHAFETACIIRGIPYGRKGSSSFFGSHETMTMLGYVQLLTGDNMAKMQASLGIIINKPNRVYVSERHGKDAVKEAIREYAKATDTFIKDLNPMVALRDSRFQDVLARKLTRSRPGDFKFDKAVESLETLTDELDQIQMDMDDPEFKTKDLFNGILGLSGKDTKTDPKTGRRLPVATSLGNVLAGQLRDAKGKEDDEEEEDDDAPLGNVAFLYELAEVDPTDEADLENDPGTPLGFKAKMERYAERMRELRIDLSKYTGPIDELPGVYLGTSHSVKGLEWNNTFVSMPSGKFPLELRVDPEDPPTPEEMEAHMEDERRLAYVALTRSMKNMTILCPNFVEGKEAGVSMFVDEAGLGMGENIAQVGTDAAIVEEAEGIMKKEAADDYEGPPSLRPEDIAYLKGRWNPKGGE